MCDVDEAEFAEYLRYVEAGLAAPVPGLTTSPPHGAVRSRTETPPYVEAEYAVV